MSMRFYQTGRPRRGPSRSIGLSLLLLPLFVGLGEHRSESAATSKSPTVESPPARRWRLVERVIAQDQGDWQVDYRLRLDATSGLVLAPAELGVAVDGWVSNSRVPVHAVPRRSVPKVDGATGTATATSEVIPSPDDAKCCRERLVVRAWAADTPEPPARPKNTPAGAADPLAPVSIAPGGVLCIRLRLEHEHFLYGPYDPMLGLRDVTLRLGPTTLRDVLPLDREHYLAQAKECWPTPPEDRRDTRHFVSGPDSLLLEAHIPGNQYYRFPEKPVRYATKMKLTFSYLIAPGGEGEFRVRLAQYKDSPSGWQVLHQGAIEQSYCVVGRWTKVERIVRTEAEATSLALDFRIYGADIGEVWVDDVKLEPVGVATGGP
jgi:hypothetical protein